MSTGERRSRRSRTLASIFVVTGLFTLFTPPKAVHAFATVTDVGTACTSTGQLCEPPFPLDLDVATEERLQVNYIVPPGHCSSVRLHLFVDRELRLIAQGK